MSFYKEVPGRKTTLESTLKFDTAPTAGSTNPVTSDGVNTAITESVGSASEALQEQIDDIAEKAGSGYIPKGEADVATLNGLSGQENGWLYTMTDAGTLTDGSLAVVAGDTVAWDEANSVWYKAMDYAPAQYGTNEVHNLATTITAFRAGDMIAVDGPSGTAKMSKDDLLKETKENALAGSNAYTDFEEIVGNVALEDYASSVVTIAVDNYYVKSSNSQIQSSTGYAISNTITLNAGESIFIVAGGASTYVAMISLYDADADTYSMVTQSTTSDRKLYSYKNDSASAVNVRLSYYKANKPYIYIKGVVGSYDKQFNEISDYEAIIGENLFVNYSSEEVSIAVDNYYVRASNNQMQSATGYAISASITLKAGETIMMVAGGASTLVAMISLYDSGLDTYSMVVQSNTSDRKFYSYRNDSASDVVVRLSYVKARKPYIVIKGKSIGDASFRQFLADDYLARIRDLQVPHKFSPFTGGVVAFVFDDTLADVDKIASLFATKGKPCCFATIPSFLNSAASVSGTRGEALLQAQANGCEILSHGSVSLTSASSDWSVYNTFVLNKQKLVNYGFKVDGIIETGGTGYNTFNYSRGYDYLREFYSYSDGYGKDLGFPQYYLNNRAWLSSVTSDNRAIIDNAVANNKFVLVSAHGVDVAGGIGLSVLEDVLDYAIAQNVEIITIRNVMTKYRDYN